MRGLGRTLVNFALLFALTVWGGMVFFFTFVAAPAVFATLDRDAAARLLGALFPRYYTVQLVCVVVALAVLAGRVAWGGAPRRPALVALALLGGALAITLYAEVGLLPQMAALQARIPSFVTTSPNDPLRLAYGQLHGRAMLLNAIAALLGGAVLVLIAFAPRLLLGSTARPASQQADVATPHYSPARLGELGSDARGR